MAGQIFITIDECFAEFGGCISHVLLFSDRQWHVLSSFSHFLSTSTTCFTLVTSPGRDRARVDSPQICRSSSVAATWLSRRAGDLSGPLGAPPTRRRRRLREPEDARWRPAGSAARARRARRAHTGRAPPIFSRCAPPLSGYGGGGRWRLPPPLAQVQRMVVPRAHAAAEADLPSPTPVLAIASVGLGCRQTPRAHGRPLPDSCGRRD